MLARILRSEFTTAAQVSSAEDSRAKTVNFRTPHRCRLYGLELRTHWRRADNIGQSLRGFAGAQLLVRRSDAQPDGLCRGRAGRLSIIQRLTAGCKNGLALVLASIVGC